MLSSSFALLHKMFDSQHQFICALDRERKFIYINNACKALWGNELKALIRASNSDLMVANDQKASISATS